MLQAALASLFLLAGDATSGKLAVVVTGPNPETSASLQRAIEANLTARRIPIAGAEDVAGVLGETTPAAPSFKRGWDKAADLLDLARRDYLEGSLGPAEERITAAIAMTDTSPAVPIEERTTLLLWRATVLLGAENSARAEADAHAALTLVPDLAVDTAVFPPSLKRLVEARRLLLVRSEVVLQGLPRSASVRIDGVAQPAAIDGARLSIPEGRHWLGVSAPGYVAVDRSFEAKGARTVVAVPLALALGPELDAALAAILERGVASDAAKAKLDSVAERLGVDRLLIARAASNESRTFFWRRGGPGTSGAFSAGREGAVAIGGWAAERMLETVVALPAQTVPVARNPSKKKPLLLWGAIGVGVLAAGAGAVAASQAGGGTRTVTEPSPGPGGTRIGWGN